MSHMSHKNIEIRRTLHLRGPSIWTYRPIIEALIDIGELEDFPSNTLPGFNERLSAWLPGLIEHRCSPGVRGGFLQRMAEGTWPGHILEHVTLELQTRAGMPTGFGKAREAGPRGVYKVVFRTDDAACGLRALHMARDLIMAAIEDRPYDVQGELAKLTQMVDDRCLGPSTASIVERAIERKIPFIRLNVGSLVQLGHGARQRRIWTAETDRTSAIAEGISRDKDLTKQLLGRCGIPVPEGQIVDSPAAAWAAAQELGLPVVVKPDNGNRSRGVSLELRERADIEAAYDLALAQGRDVMVERFITGVEHRLLVVGQRLAAATRGETTHITGDGQHTVRELVELQVNADPRRGQFGDAPLEIVDFDKQPTSVLELQRQGLTPQSVPEAGRRVLVQRTGNMSTDVTDQVHPDVAALAVLAAKVVGLDIAGVDVVTPDIGQPLEKVGGAVVEVNAGPSLLMHLNPAHGEPRPVGRMILDHLFTHQEDGRIPLVGLMGNGDTTRAARLTAWLLQLQVGHTGLSCRDGLFVNQRRLHADDPIGFEDAERLLINRQVQAAVFESDLRHLMTEGLPYDRCQVGVVTRMPGTAGLEELYPGDDDRVPGYVRTQIDVVLPGGACVLNAEDDAVAALSQYCDGETIYFASSGDLPRIAEHRQQGGRVAFWRDGTLVLARGQQETEVLAVQRPAVSRLLREQLLDTTDMLVAACTAWALGMGAELIRAGVKSYGQSAATH